MSRVLLLLVLAVIWCTPRPAGAHAQTETSPVSVEWSVEEPPEGGWTVGDPVSLRLRVTHPANLNVTIPELPGAWGAFEVLDQRLLGPTENEDGKLATVREATVTLWAPGDYQTPALAVGYRDADGQLHEVPVPPVSITIASVLQEGETEKRDLKPQASLPRPPVWPWVLGGLLLAALLGVAGWAILTRLRLQAVPNLASTPVRDPHPPHEIAYGELERIAALNLLARGELKQHYTLVADCLRAYVQGRYHIPAMDQTTEELMSAFHQARVDRGHVRLFRELLTEADLVKFAKLFPPVEQARTLVTQARHVVDVTTPAQEPSEGRPDEPAGSHAKRTTRKI